MHVQLHKLSVIPGPSILALMSVISASLGKILMPSGGSLVRSAISRAICLMTCGDRFSMFDVEHWKNIRKMSLCMRKPTIWVSDQVRHKPGCTVTETG